MKFVDLGLQYYAYKNEIDEALREVVESGSFINGPQIAALEKELAEFSGARYAVACSSGTDALMLAMFALGVKPGDEIIVPAFSFIATASMVSFLGAIPVFVDVGPESYTMDPERIEEKISERTKGIIPVSLFGQCARLEEIEAIARRNGLFVLEDGAQSFGAVRGIVDGPSHIERCRSCSCTDSDIAVTSFFPAKPLGGYGDGGAVFTNDAQTAETLRRLRNHGQESRYRHEIIGLNARMDSLQAAVLLVKLRHFSVEIERRRNAAAIYQACLSGLRQVETPMQDILNESTWAQYTIRVPYRDKVREELLRRGIPSAVHYPLPLPMQKAFGGSGQNVRRGYRVSEELSMSVLSLPMHAFLTEAEQCEVCVALDEVLAGLGEDAMAEVSYG
ncbi:MAG: DegT/DnrJ/EryC1/StrS family aminotransferase [Spirochaetaceae bacterium]|nr:DegT/DnrJ/EryC1/StrS family aminotransferase [Spirochaetaceae bacterium]MCF7947169.1 DegT/DnrJ/EryC1/StrS family aminotransferase [Spirochaetia bacterium]MCF7950034.1 DegT/DnrJ/EryC1/StrS family aminotransferase [Spirochaetaceae bacterium]